MPTLNFNSNTILYIVSVPEAVRISRVLAENDAIQSRRLQNEKNRKLEKPN